MAEHKCYEVTIMKIKPKYGLAHLAAFPSYNVFMDKVGSKLLGHWLVEAGPGVEHIMLRTWASVDDRQAAIQQLVKDTTYLAQMQQNAKHMASSTSYLCISHPLMPLKTLPAGERLYMEQIGYKGSPIAAAQKYKEVNDKWAAMSGGGQSAALGLLAPTTFDKPCLFGFHAAPAGKMNPVAELWEKCLANPEVYPLIDDYYSQVQDSAARILMPVPDFPNIDGGAPAPAQGAAAPAEAAKAPAAPTPAPAPAAIVAEVKEAAADALQDAKAAVQGAADAVMAALPAAAAPAPGTK